MEVKWKVKEGKIIKKRIFPELEEATEKILTERGFESEKELEAFFVPDYEKDLHDPFLLNDMNKAVKRTLTAQENKEKICIFGDFDADGVASSTLLTDFLRDELKVEVFCYIPDREKEGYGLNIEAIDYIIAQGATLMITVDCGITNVKEVAYAKKNGLDTIVLDHHNVLGKVPEALAVIDPKNPKEEKYPFKELAGVGVTFKFAQAIAKKSKKISEEQLKWYLDLVAVGTIADCVPLLDENRTLVKFGLMVLSKTKRAGFKQLFQNGRMKISESEFPTAEQVAFQIAPRINAAGRMKHASIAYELLTEGSPAKASKLAKEIEKQNQERQKVTADILKKVKKEIDNLRTIPKVIIKSSPKWKIGIIGLSAGRLADEYARPVILLQEKDGIFRGSGRSVPGYNLVNALKRQSEFLKRFGGHDQAAGLSMLEEDFPKFKKAFEADVKSKITKKIVKTIEADVKVSFEEIGHKLCNEILMLEPFGKGNELPILLLEKALVVNKKLLGNGEKHLKLWLAKNENNAQIVEAIGFGLGEGKGKLKSGDKIDILFHLEPNNWNGTKSLQLRIVDYRKSK